MAFDEIPKTGLVDFVERQRKQSSLWGFVHVPKTAGSSVNAAMTRVCGPFRTIFPKTYLVGTEELNALRWEAVREFVDIQHSLAGEKRYKSFSGHIWRRHTDFIRSEFPEVRLFTILRNPIQRVISDYRYCLTPTPSASMKNSRAVTRH